MRISSDDSSATVHAPIDSDSQVINSATSKKEEEICFIEAQNCCVCFIDIVNSTRITSNINNPEKVRKYYKIFLNTMAAIARNSGAKITKKCW